MSTNTAMQADHNSLGKAAFIMGILSLILAFVPFIGFASWLLAPLAMLCGVIAVLRPRRSLAIAGILTGALGLLICFWWVGAAKTVGEALNRDTFNETGTAITAVDAPIIDATIGGVWLDMEANKIAAGQKYGGHRLRFSNVAVVDFGGDVRSPSLTFEGKREKYLTHLVSAAFAADDGPAIAGLSKGQKVSFVCGTIRETLGGGYNLGDCKLSQ